MTSLFDDARKALRMLAKTPGFTGVAILTLALGIGANTAIFTVASSVLLRPLPFANPDRLIIISAASANQRSDLRPMSWLRFTTIRDQNRSFSGIAAFTNETFNLSGHGDPVQVASARVSANFFDVLGVRPTIGRSFLANEDQPGGANSILVSHSFWMTTLGGARNLIGERLTLDSRDYTIIGVLPASFQFAPLGRDIDLWAPRVFEMNLITPQQVQGGSGFLTAVARLRPGAANQQAQADMDILNLRYQHAYPGRPDADPRQVIDVQDLKEQIVANIRPALLLLSSAVALLLLIACANVASLLLSRALARRKEIAVRAALGAGRGLIIRELLVESALLGLLGGAAGALLAAWCIDVLDRFGGQTALPSGELHLDFGVLAFTAAISILSGLLFGLVPSLIVSRPDVNELLRDEGRGATAARSRSRVRSLIQRVRALPGVEAAAISSALPVNPMRLAPVLLEGQPEVPIAQRPVVNIQAISPEYARVLRLPLIGGRVFNAHDDAHAPRVVMVNETLGRRFWPKQNPIGKKVWIGRLETAAEVVGVLGDVKNTSLAADASPEVFLPFPQLPWAHLNLSLRSAGVPSGLAGGVRAVIAEIDREQPVTHVQTLEDVLAASASERRFTMLLLGSFSGTAIILALIGIYGLVAYSVTQRNTELGIRIALGATRGDILRLVLGHGTKLALYGVAIGAAGSLMVTRLLSGMLYRTSTTDPLIFLLSAALFTLAALAASYVPARRAMKIDPVEALR